MSNVFVIGAAGKVGKRLVKMLSGNGHKVIALHRKPEQAQALQACGADPVPGNLMEMNASGLAGVRRFLLVSAFPEAARGTDTSAGFENYMRVKKEADVRLASSRLDWVILRPGTLLDSPGTGEVRAGLAIPYGNIARDDVAAFLSALVDRPDISRQIIELTEGDTPVEVAASRFNAR